MQFRSRWLHLLLRCLRSRSPSPVLSLRRCKLAKRPSLYMIRHCLFLFLNHLAGLVLSNITWGRRLLLLRYCYVQMRVFYSKERFGNLNSGPGWWGESGISGRFATQLSTLTLAMPMMDTTLDLSASWGTMLALDHVVGLVPRLRGWPRSQTEDEQFSNLATFRFSTFAMLFLRVWRSCCLQNDYWIWRLGAYESL